MIEVFEYKGNRYYIRGFIKIMINGNWVEGVLYRNIEDEEVTYARTKEEFYQKFKPE